jgi:uncharacterized protein YjbJ (UPF0337 family)
MSINKNQVTGKLMRNETLEANGNIKMDLGKVQSKLGDLKQDVKESAK